MKTQITKNWRIATVAIAFLLGISSLAQAGPPDGAPPPENMGTQQIGAAIEGLTGGAAPQMPFCVLHPIQALNVAIATHPDAAQTCMDIASGALDASGAGPIAP